MSYSEHWTFPTPGDFAPAILRAVCAALEDYDGAELESEERRYILGRGARAMRVHISLSYELVASIEDFPEELPSNRDTFLADIFIVPPDEGETRSAMSVDSNDSDNRAVWFTVNQIASEIAERLAATLSYPAD